MGCCHLNNLVARRALGERQASYCFGLPWSLPQGEAQASWELRMLFKIFLCWTSIEMFLRVYSTLVMQGVMVAFHVFEDYSLIENMPCQTRLYFHTIPSIPHKVGSKEESWIPTSNCWSAPFIVISFLSFNISFNGCSKLCCFFCQSLSQNLNLKNIKSNILFNCFLGAIFVVFWHTTYIVLRYFLQCFMLTFFKLTMNLVCSGLWVSNLFLVWSLRLSFIMINTNLKGTYENRSSSM